MAYPVRQSSGKIATAVPSAWQRAGLLQHRLRVGVRVGDDGVQRAGSHPREALGVGRVEVHGGESASAVPCGGQ